MQTKKSVAIIDVGTNTFHLMIRDWEEGSILLQDKRYVKLASGGIGFIESAAIERALAAMEAFAEEMKQFGVIKTLAFGTAGMRTAANAPQLIAEIFAQTGIQIQLIDGQREAELICKGVAQAVDLEATPSLIMDIGGGSVEFILYQNKAIAWKNSYPIGAAILLRQFHQEDPITATNIEALRHFLKSHLTALWKVIEKYQPQVLIGASGSFDTLVDMHLFPQGKSRNNERPANEISLATFYHWRDEIVQMSIEKRLAVAGMPHERAEMIVVAFLLIEQVLQKSNILHIIQTDYAMKEGIWWEIKHEKL
ncbi:MAG: hypothetical protein R2798_07240 [Chitinophagales bacterium]|nr:phosphatase [Bacteroidota bacterium]